MQLTTEQKTQLAEFCANCAFDPLRWAERAFPWGRSGDDLERFTGPRTWQREILTTIRDRLSNPETRYKTLKIAVASGHGIGKSALIGMLTSWTLACHVGSRINITANTEGQLNTKTSPEVGQWVKRSLANPLFKIGTESIKSEESANTTTWRADFITWSEKNPAAFAGLHNAGKIILMVMDEASGIPRPIWETAQGALTDADTIMIWLAFGNPLEASGEFAEKFRGDSGWITYNIDNRTVEGVNVAEQQAIVDRYGEDSDYVRARVRGVFPLGAIDSLFAEGDIDLAMGRVLPVGSQDHAAVILGVDVARQGDDSSIVACRQGNAAHIARSMQIPNSVMVGNAVASAQDELSADGTFIDMSGGYGAGVYDHLQTNLNRDCVGVQFGGSADKKEQFFDKRAEMYWQFAQWIKNGGQLPLDLNLKKQLLATKYLHIKGRLRIIEKDDIKKEIGQSPDEADAFALTFAGPVAKKQRYAATTKNREDRQRGHDPFKR